MLGPTILIDLVKLTPSYGELHLKLKVIVIIFKCMNKALMMMLIVIMITSKL